MTRSGHAVEDAASKESCLKVKRDLHRRVVEPSRMEAGEEAKVKAPCEDMLLFACQ